jgi:nucleoside-diphosphate kinase
MTHPKKERTFVILKPDTIQRGLVGDILSRFEKVGLKTIAMKMIVATEEQCFAHYNKDDAWFERKGKGVVANLEAQGKKAEKETIEYGKDIVRALAKYMTAGPSLCFVLEGNKSVAVVTKLVGGTEPTTSDVGTIRGDLTVDSYEAANLDTRAVRNLVHCSESPDEALREIPIWFKENEIISYNHIQDAILYDVNLDGILE